MKDLISANFSQPMNKIMAFGLSGWFPLYESLAAECGLSQTMPQSYSELQGFFQTYVLEI